MDKDKNMDNSYSSPIALLTDFGHLDTFVGVLKGVILSINPKAVIVDLCHAVAPRDIGHGAFLLDTSLGYFPKGTIFCVVVDPGVGSSRRAVLVQTRDYVMVGPDNGILWQAARRNGIQQAVHLTEIRYFLSSVSATFHGRDMFAPVAAHLSLGMEPSAFGPPVRDLISFAAAEPVPVENGLEIAVKNANAAAMLNVSRNDQVLLTAQGRA
ncbi:MAG: SAM-dependent chlorinase/fluorinase [Desulfobacteraceae bacterium]|nr:SAM-dependent chlorinase/fluorinase [Desulfobacteraceae bacterium]